MSSLWSASQSTRWRVGERVQPYGVYQIGLKEGYTGLALKVMVRRLDSTFPDRDSRRKSAEEPVTGQRYCWVVSRPMLSGANRSLDRRRRPWLRRQVPLPDREIVPSLRVGRRRLVRAASSGGHPWQRSGCWQDPSARLYNPSKLGWRNIHHVICLHYMGTR